MSFFDGVDVDEIPDNPNELPNDTYKFRVTSAKYGPTKNKDKHGINFKHQIIEGPWSTFFPINDWIQVPDANVPPSERQRMLAALKMRLRAMGFSDEEIRSFGKDSVSETLNRQFYGTTHLSKKDGNPQVRIISFDPIEDDGDNVWGDGPGV